MRRWHLTLGLGITAVAAAALAPRLFPKLAGTTTPPEATPVAEPEELPVSEPWVEPVVRPDIPDIPAGHLTVDAALDREAVLAGESNVRFLTVTVTAPDNIGDTFRRPVDLSVVLDASGSMSARGKIDYAKRAAKLLASSMEKGDNYSLVIFNDDATTIVPSTEIDDPAAIHRAISGIYEGGGTNLYAGMDQGAKQIHNTLGEMRVGRLIVLSDGIANVGITDPGALSRYAATLATENVTVSTVGLGLDYNEDLLARLADLGGGTYDFVDQPRELETVFADELERTASLVARGTKVTISLPEGVEPLELYGWDAEQSGNTWTVWMGDVTAGSSKKIVTRVRVHGDTPGESQVVASATVDYLDLIDAVESRVADEAVADTTVDRHAVEASINNGAAVEANRAWGNWYLDQSSRAWADGDVDKARRLAKDGENILIEAGAAYDNDDLVQEAQDLREQRELFDTTAPSSVEGKYAIKRAKEMYRGRSR